MAGLATFGGAILAMVLATPSLAQGPAAYAGEHVFDVFRKGDRIGSHRLTFSRPAGDLVVDVAIELQVRLAGVITVYRYRHEARETWREDRLVDLSSRTDDNGRPWSVRATTVPDGLRVRSNKPDDGAPGATESTIAGTASDTVLPAGTMPTSHWNRAWLERSAVLNTQSGALIRVSILPIASEQVATGCGPRRAAGYRIQGDLRKDIWFDEAGRWTKSAFDAPDGSRIEYVLRCPAGPIPR